MNVEAKFLVRPMDEEWEVWLFVANGRVLIGKQPTEAEARVLVAVTTGSVTVAAHQLIDGSVSREQEDAVIGKPGRSGTPATAGGIGCPHGLAAYCRACDLEQQAGIKYRNAGNAQRMLRDRDESERNGTLWRKGSHTGRSTTTVKRRDTTSGPLCT